MKYKNFILISLIIAVTVVKGFSQEEMKEKPYNTFTFFYVDNSDNYELNSLNNEITSVLKDKLKEQNNLPGNLFFFWGCNGSKPKQSDDISKFLETDFLNKYLSRASLSPDYSYEKSDLRNYFTSYPVKIKQSVEFNFFLSSNAAKKMITDVNILPTPLVFPQELLIYLNADRALQIKFNIFINNDITEKYAEDKIKSSFYFCNSLLSKSNVEPVFNFR